ncbi:MULTISPECIES: L-idonate 5-dehydrogenase [unclassified Chelatococcus]|uniref:L-idonate 5-dehydrogenase n=1 Tax=unclassified Chelatococcus TaxID=2638111 RepID=UPI000319DFE9|nr:MULTISPECIES: L-idonate 5-dehydrogenase [unclassified Chelatococcus]ALA19019.1 phosphoesterase [Chelatococcus sp. CO-6]
MRALVIHAPHDLRLESVPTAPLGPHDVLVRIAAGGICGSDLHYFHHGGFGTVRLKEPMVLGHEVAGTIAAVGAAVTRVAPGDKVAVNPSAPCGHCRYCRMGLRNQCLDMRFYGSAMRFPHVQGAFREEMVVPEGQAVKMAAGVDIALAAMCEPFAVALHAVAQAEDLAGKRVLVSGCGPIGCLVIIAARRAAAGEIVATDIAPAALAIAGEVGASRLVDVSAGTAELADLAADKGQVDVVLECSGNPQAIAGAIEVTRPGGTIVTVGLGGDVPLPMNAIVAKELLLRGSFRFDSEFDLAASLVSEGSVDLSPLLTATFPVEEAGAAFARASDRSRAMKVQIRFGDDI